MALPRKLKNYQLFVAGKGYVGESPEVTLPKLTRKMDDYRGGGMNGAVQTDQGMDKMELAFTFAGYLRDILRRFGAQTVDGVQMRFMGALQADDDASVHRLEVVCRGRYSEIDFGSQKAGDNTEIKVTAPLSYYKLILDGATVIEIDIVNMIEVVDGDDLMADIRAAIGLA